jgi:hypothetical protein
MHLQQQQQHMPRRPLQPRRDYSVQESPQWMPPPPTPNEEKESGPEESGEEEDESKSSSDQQQQQQQGDSPNSNKQKGDPLALLANVSSDMVQPGDKKGKNQKKQKKKASTASTAKAPPTSPLQRSARAPPLITPKGREGKQKQQHPPPLPQHLPPQAQAQHLSPNMITPTGGYYQPHQPPPPSYYEQQHQQQQDYQHHGGPPPLPPPAVHYQGPPPPPYARGGYPPPPSQQQQQQLQQQQPPQYYRGNPPEWEPHPNSPRALIERGGSFDTGSEGSQDYHRRGYYDYRGPPPEHGDYPQQQPPPPQQQQRHQQPPQQPPPPPHHWQQQRMAPPPDGPGRPYPPNRWSYQGHPHAQPPPYGHGHGPPPSHSQPRPPPAFAPPRDDHERPTGKHAQVSRTLTKTTTTAAQPYSPYAYVQQPHLEDKTILRKKFSWKHFPEVRGLMHILVRARRCFVATLISRFVIFLFLNRSFVLVGTFLD